jgi:uncharacterized integral membrane protein
MGMTATAVMLATTVAAATTAVVRGATASCMGMRLVRRASGVATVLLVGCLLMLLLWVLILLPRLLLLWSLLIVHLSDSSLSQMNLLFKDTRFERPIYLLLLNC